MLYIALWFEVVRDLAMVIPIEISQLAFIVRLREIQHKLRRKKSVYEIFGNTLTGSEVRKSCFIMNIKSVVQEEQ